MTNSVRAKKRISLTKYQQALWLERSANDDAWCLWLHINKSHCAGTYLHLGDDGMIFRVRLDEDGTEERIKVYE